MGNLTKENHGQVPKVTGPYICQSNSMNLYMIDPDTNKVMSALMYGWEAGLKNRTLLSQDKAEKFRFKTTLNVSSMSVPGIDMNTILSEPDCPSCG